MDLTPTTPDWSIPPADLVTYVGGVGQLFQSDHDLGRIVVERLAEQTDRLPRGTSVEDLSYGAIAASHRLREMAPPAAVLIGSREVPGRAPGTIQRRVLQPLTRSVEQLQGAVQDAGTGYVDLELTIEVCWAFDALPRRTVVFDVEPAVTTAGEQLSPAVAAALDDLLGLVDRECAWSPLFVLVDAIDARLRLGAQPAGSLAAPLRALMAAVQAMDRGGTTAAVVSADDDLRTALATGPPSELAALAASVVDAVPRDRLGDVEAG